jgi:hypothetical protein
MAEVKLQGDNSEKIFSAHAIPVNITPGGL